jgi:hypothetical protein
MSHPINVVISGFTSNKPNSVQVAVSSSEIYKFSVDSRVPRPFINRNINELGNILDFRVNYLPIYKGKLEALLGQPCVIYIKAKYYKFPGNAGKQIEGYKFTIDNLEDLKNLSAKE